MKRLVSTERASGSAAVAILAASLLASALGGCVNKTPRGQVVAVVNGAEVTAQDLHAEQRALGTTAFDPQALTQRVVNRVLLAQAAHAQKLDSYAAFPADMIRLRQDFLAEQLVRADVKPPPAPTPAEIDSFIQSHPLAFNHRMRLVIDELKFQPLDGLNALLGTNTLSEMEARLKGLDTPVQRTTVTADTAAMPPELAGPLVAAPLGQVVVVRGTGATFAMVVQQRTPVVLSPEQTQSLARQLLVRFEGQQALSAKIKSLRSRANIVYQSGYSPASSTAKAAGRAGPPASPSNTAS